MMRRIYISEAISNIGSRITGIALAYMLYRQTGRASDLGIYVMLLTLPAIIFSNPAGRIADKFNRKFLLIYADITRAVILVVMALLAPAGWIWGLLFAYFLTQIFRSLYDTCITPFASELAKGGQALTAAIANLKVIYYLSIVVGFGIGGFVAYYLTPTQVFLMDAATFAVSVFLVRSIPFREGTAPGYFRVLKEMFSWKYYSRWFHLVAEGFRIAAAKEYRKSIVFLELVREFAYGFFNPIQSFWPQARFSAIENSVGLSACMGSLGGILGGLFTGRYTSKRLKDGKWFFWICLFFTVAELLAFLMAYSAKSFLLFSSGLLISSGGMSSFEAGAFSKYISSAAPGEEGSLSGFFQFITMSAIFAGSVVYFLIADSLPQSALPFVPIFFLLISVAMMLAKRRSFEDSAV